MTPHFLIREAQATDYPAIYPLVEEVFVNHPHSDHTEQLIVQRLRQRGQLTLSLVAQSQAVLIGYVAFSPVTVSGQIRGWYGLGPVAVATAYQRAGIGRALIGLGLAELKAHQAMGCVVAGDPAYYGRFGFSHPPALVADSIPPAYFMAMSFDGSELPSGKVDYSPAFFS